MSLKSAHGMNPELDGPRHEDGPSYETNDQSQANMGQVAAYLSALTSGALGP